MQITSPCWIIKSRNKDKNIGIAFRKLLLNRGDVNIISGVHGEISGITTPDLGMYEADVEKFRHMPGVTVHNFSEMTPEEINNLLNAPGTTIGGFCNSAACLAPYR